MLEFSVLLLRMCFSFLFFCFSIVRMVLFHVWMHCWATTSFPVALTVTKPLLNRSHTRNAFVEQPSKSYKARGKNMEQQRRGTVPHSGGAQHECKPLWLLRQSRKRSCCPSCLSSKEILSAAFLHTSNNSDWFKCQIMLCSDILPTPCGVCVCLYMFSCACVCLCVRICVAMIVCAWDSACVPAVCMHYCMC